MHDVWEPAVELTEEEENLLKLCKKQKLWEFLREYRGQLLDEEMRKELAAVYRPSGRGPAPVAPEQLALAMLLQVAFGVADHEVPTLTVADRRWQMILDCAGATEPAFSQGTVFNFRERMRKNGLMPRLLEKTVELARETKGFSHKRLRALIDSSPIVGAGRVEDTINLLGRAIHQLVEVAAHEAEEDLETLTSELSLSIFGSPSVKAALDVDWRLPTAKSSALNELLGQFHRVQEWLRTHFDAAALAAPPLAEYIRTVERVIEQDTEPEPTSPPEGEEGMSERGAQAGPADGPTMPVRRQITKGTSPDRLISISDQDMRFGRKTTTKVFAGYKRHVLVDADVPGLICDVEIVPGNKREYEAAKPLLDRARERDYQIQELQADRGYLPSEEVNKLHEQGVSVVSKPPTPRRTGRYTKYDFDVDFEAKTAVCPEGVTIPLKLESVMAVPIHHCRACPSQAACLSPKATQKKLRLHPKEQWFRQMGQDMSTSTGRAKRRQRIPVEHALGRVSSIQGNKARFRGLEKNQFDLERTAIINNCFILSGAFKDAAAA